MMKIFRATILSLILFVGVANAADPLSRDGLLPTLIPFDGNTATVSDSINAFPDVAYFMITVPADQQLSSIVVTADENSDGGYWFAVMSGTQFTENSTESNQIITDNILGHEVIGGLGVNVLPSMADGTRGEGAIGFDEVLPAGDYAFRIQNWQRGGTFTLELTAEPSEPAASIPMATYLNTITTHTPPSLPLLIITLFTLVLLCLRARLYGRKNN